MGTDPLPVKNGRYIKHVCIGEFGGHIDGCLTSGGGGCKTQKLGLVLPIKSYYEHCPVSPCRCGCDGSTSKQIMEMYHWCVCVCADLPKESY